MYIIRFIFDFKNIIDCFFLKNYFGLIFFNNKDCFNFFRILIYGFVFEILIKCNYYK